jgi:putative endonuclease
MASYSGTLYVGVTCNIRRRVFEHKNKLTKGFTKKYNIDRLLYFETISDSFSAIEREKQIKRWRREKKVKLIETLNPDWNDLSCDWYD